LLLILGIVLLALENSAVDVNCSQECHGQVCRKVYTSENEWSSQQPLPRSGQVSNFAYPNPRVRYRRENKCGLKCDGGSCFMTCQ